MRLLALLPIAALTACIGKTELAIEIRTVPVPTPVACVKTSDIPAEPDRVASKLNDDAVHDLAVVSTSALELRTYGGSLRALLTSCTSP